MKINILALGDRFSDAYRSLEHELVKQGNLSFYRESDFKNLADALNYIRNSSFNLVIMPNPYGNKRRQLIYKELNKVNFPVIAFDRGGLPDSWFFDTGFNADSITYHPLKWDKVLTEEEKNIVISYIEKIKYGNSALEEQGKRIGGISLKKELGLEDKKVIFVPFQRPNDTVIKFFSDGYEDFVQEIEKLNYYIEKNLSNEWRIVAKKHPLEEKRPSSLITFVQDDTNVYDLIEMSDMVVLINSGVGLLSMLWNKPVLYFGKIYYAHSNINIKVNSFMDILYYMNNPLKVDSEKVYRFINYLYSEVYSYGNFETKKIIQKDGNYRNITKYIDFEKVNFPKLEKIIKKKFFL